MNLRSISKQFVPSIISDLLESRDEDGQLIRRYRDVELIRREQNFSQYCDYERLKTYVASSLTPSQFQSFQNDEEAFMSIIPRSVDSPTMFYQYAKYLKETYDSSSRDLESNVASINRVNEFLERYSSRVHSSDSSDNKNDSNK